MSSIEMWPHAFWSARGSIRARIGQVDLPLHEAGDGPPLRMTFARFGARDPTPDAVFLLSGGPGHGAIDWLTQGGGQMLDLVAELSRRIDVIVPDQRGTGFSLPSTTSSFRWSLPLDGPMTRHSLGAAARTISATAISDSLDAGIDLRGFTTEASADDLEALRRRLGYRRIVVMGASYGSHLGLSMLRRHEGSVSRCLLMMVEGPDHTWKLPSHLDRSLAELSAAALEDLTIAGANIADGLEATIDALEQEPVESTSSSGNIVALGADDLRFHLAELIGDLRFLRRLPLRVDDLIRGDLTWLADVAEAFRTARAPDAMTWAMDAASGVSEQRRAAIAEESSSSPFEDALNWPMDDLQRAWNNALGASFRSAPASSLPVVFASNGWDPRTPEANVEEIRDGFPAATSLVFERYGHTLRWLYEEPWRSRLISYLASGDQPADERVETRFVFATT